MWRVSNELSDLVAQLNRDGYEARINPNYGTIDITGVKGRPLLDPWPLLIDLPRLKHVLIGMKAHLGLRASTKQAIETLAFQIESDVKTYSSADGPFALDQHGYAMRTTLE